MTADQIITIVCLSIVGIVLLFFLTPTFIFLCDDFGEIVSDIVSGWKLAFIETANKWKYIFKRWTK